MPEIKNMTFEALLAKLHHLIHEEATSLDCARIFELRQQIEEVKQEAARRLRDSV